MNGNTSGVYSTRCCGTAPTKTFLSFLSFFILAGGACHIAYAVLNLKLLNDYYKNENFYSEDIFEYYYNLRNPTIIFFFIAGILTILIAIVYLVMLCARKLNNKTSLQFLTVLLMIQFGINVAAGAVSSINWTQ